MLVSRGPGQIMSRIFVPANTVVKLKSTVFVNETQLNGTADTIDNNSLPVLIARGRQTKKLGNSGHSLVRGNPCQSIGGKKFPVSSLNVAFGRSLVVTSCSR